MSFSKLLAILTMLSVLLAPALANAAQPKMAPEHHQQMLKSGHCDSAPSEDGKQQSKAKKSCCVSTCMGMAVSILGASAADETPVRAVGGDFPPPQFGSGILAEIATPPPRVS